MKLIAKTIPFGLEFILQCLSCQQKFLLDPSLGLMYRVIDYPSTDLERATYNRRIIANQWFIEGYLAVEQWLEEHPYTEWRENPSSHEREKYTKHDLAMVEGNSGIDRPEKRRK